MEFGLFESGDNSKSKIYNFYGFNKNPRGNKGEMEDMHNMSSSRYPCAHPRGKREETVRIDEKILAVAGPDSTNVIEVNGFTGICKSGFYYNGVKKNVSGGGTVFSDSYKWQIVRKGNLYIINGYNPKTRKSKLLYYNVDTDKLEYGGVVLPHLIVRVGTQNGENYIRPFIQGDAYTYETTLPDGNTTSVSMFQSLYGDSIRNRESIFEKYFEVGDVITLEGFPDNEEAKSTMFYIYDNKLVPGPDAATNCNENNTVDPDDTPDTTKLDKWAVCNAVITGFDDNTSGGCGMRVELFNKDNEKIDFTNTDHINNEYCMGITVSKEKKNFDNITVHQGRIWGTVPSGNQIYASASDNIFSFTAEDISKAYAVRFPSDTPGVFKGICSYNNDIVAFKDESITIISGTGPMNYNSIVLNGIGCIDKNSVTVTPYGVVFLGFKGFYIYDGSLPRCISSKLGSTYKSALSGFDGERYFAAGVKADGSRELSVYDMRYDLWHIEDDIDAKGFFRFCDEFYVADSNAVYKMGTSCDDVDWYFTLMRTHENSMDNKGINEIWIRAEVSNGAEFKVETAVGNGEFKEHRSFTKPGINVYRCPIRHIAGESYRVKIAGRGGVTIYEIELKKADGGRRYKEYGRS